MKHYHNLLAVILLWIVTMPSFAQFSGSGSGTQNDPYLILNPIQLNQLRNFLNKEGVYFKLMANIDLTEFLDDENPTQGWQPVGTSSSPFKGVLDGNGKTISGFWINRNNTDNIGFFGCTNGATIKDLTLEGGTIKGKNNVGMLIGLCSLASVSSYRLSGKIIGITNIGGTIGSCGIITISDIESSIIVYGEDNTGGLIGMANGSGNDKISITNCSVSADNIDGDNYVGGICGALNGWRNVIVDNCIVYTDISGNDYVGGIIGKLGKDDNSSEETHINHAIFAGNVSGHKFVGGIVGAFTHASYYNIMNEITYDTHNHPSIKKCAAMGNILGENDYVGGVIGYDVGNYSQSHLLSILNLVDNYFTGSIKGNNYVGGIVGSKFMGWIHNCYSSASISGKDYVGGICGYLGWTGGYYPARLKSCVANNTYLRANGNSFGRIYGFCQSGCEIGNTGTSADNKSYNRTIVINKGVAQDITDDEQNGTGVSSTTLKLKATYVAMGWGFSQTWNIQETECYPYFKTQTTPPIITSQLVSGTTTVSGKCVDGGIITLEIDGVKQQKVSMGNTFSFTVSPLQAGHEVRVSAKADDKEQSYYTMEVVSFLGKGTEADPYQISTAADLTQVYRKGYYKLMNDIDLTDYINQFSPTEGWQSIGREGSETIHFDGDGHKITGLWCNSTRDNTGLFSCFANGDIKNLTVEVANGKQVKGGANTGIIIGKMINGTIESCKVVGKVADGTPVGGIIGLLNGGSISKSQANVTINTTGATSYVGGVVGEITSGTVDQCVTTGTLTATGATSYVGGLIGKNSATVTNSYSTATVTSSYNAAGLVAYNYGIVDMCYATGNLYSNNYAAGIIGYNDGQKAVVRNCIAMNNKIDVTYESQSAQSGGYGQRIIGGIKNGAPAPELNNYALKSMQVSVNNVAQKVYDDIMNGVGKNASDLLKANTYQELGWNFTDTWTINENKNYPLLKNNTGVAVEPGEDPNTDPEPVLSDDDKIVVAEVTASKGQQATIGIDLENKTTDLTAYQFDLTLPDGVSLSLNDKGKFLVTKTGRYEDDSQTLNISKLEGNTYRFVCFSMSNEVITGMSGAILNASLTIGESVNVGSYEATITNIVVTKQDGTQLKLNDSKFNIVVTNVIKGDANGDSEVNVSDIVEMVNYIMGKPSANFVQAAADLNGDGEVNVTDIVKVVSIIMDTNGSRASLCRSAMKGNLTVRGKGLSKMAMVQHAEQFTAAQFDVILGDGQEIDDISLSSNSDHCLTWKMTEDGTCRVVVYSLTNSAFDVNGSELMNIRLKGMNGEIAVRNVVLVAANSNTTGISKMTTDKSLGNWYTLDGRELNRQPSEKGIYVKNGKKLVVR